MSWFGTKPRSHVTSGRRGAVGPVRMLAPLVGLSVLCAACSDLYLDRRETIALPAGDALAGDKVVHIIDPWPPGSHNRRIASNGERMQAAAERYRTNRVTAPRSMTTSSVVTTSAGSGGAATPAAASSPPGPASTGQY
jgi:hypothetical protein